MSMVDRVIRQLNERGLRVVPGPDDTTLLLSGPASEKTPAVMATVKLFKPELLERFGRRAQHDLPGERPDAIATAPEPVVGPQ